MDQQKTPTRSKRTRSRVPNISTSQPQIPSLHPPNGESDRGIHHQMPSPTGAIHHQSSNFISNPQVSFTSMLLQPQMSYVPPTQSQAYEPRDPQQSSSEEDNNQGEGDDVVPETQPPPQPTGTSNTAQKTSTRSKPKAWKAKEEVELAKAWAETSEDSNIDKFWNTVKASFDERMGCGPDYRSIHCITSKTKALLTSVAKFSGIYNNAKNTKKSGENDTIILQKARYRYQQENHKAFPHEHALEILQECEKFKRIHVLGPTIRAPRPSKRSKTSESATPTTESSDAINLEDEDAAEDEAERPRPMGRNAARRGGSTSTAGGSDESVTALLSELNTLVSKGDSILEYRQKELEIRERNSLAREARQKRKDFDFYISPHGHLSGGALATTLQMKEEIRQQYGWEPLDQ